MIGQRKILTVRLEDGSAIKLAYRHGTKDRFTIVDVWERHPYRLSQFGIVARRTCADDEYHRITAAGATPLLIDAGANIGASVAFFVWRYPLARIVAIEPDPGNFELLKENTAIWSQVVCVQGALANTDGELQLFDPGRSTDAYRVHAADPQGLHGEPVGRVAAYSIRTLQALHGDGAEPFFAKIDIEGGESELFAANTDWVDDYPIIAIELHDWMLPGQASAASFLKCVAEKGRDFVNPEGNDVTFSLRN
jgi:FkbM family methyltransferase